MQDSRDIDPTSLPQAIDALPGIDAVRRLAEQVPTYLVGGVVRDLLLGAEGKVHRVQLNATVAVPVTSRSASAFSSTRSHSRKLPWSLARAAGSDLP